MAAGHERQTGRSRKKEEKRYRDRAARKSTRWWARGEAWKWPSIALATFCQPENHHQVPPTLKASEDPRGGILRDCLRGCPLPPTSEKRSSSAVDTSQDNLKYWCLCWTQSWNLRNDQPLPGRNNGNNNKWKSHFILLTFLLSLVSLLSLLLFSNLNLNLWGSS